MTALSQLVFDYQQLQDKLKRLYRMRNLIGNMHCYAVSIGGELITGAEHSFTDAAKEAMVDSINIPIRKAEAELQALEAKVA